MFFQTISGIHNAVSRRSEAPENLSYLVQLAQMTWLKAIHGIGPQYYLLAGFYRRSIPYAIKRTHMSTEQYRKWIDAKNDPLYRKISQDKLVEKAYLACLGIPRTEYLGFLHPEIGIAADQTPLRTPNDMVQMLDSIQGTKIVMKRREGWGGYAVRVFKKTAGPVTGLECLKTGELISLTEEDSKESELFDQGGWLVEDYFEQHSVMRSFNTSSVNTLRMWVMQDNDNAKPVFLGGYLRVGRENAVVDNQSSGGVVCPIDSNTGEVAAAQDGTIAREESDNHPDHGAQLRGAVIPFWHESKELALRALAVFPQMNFCGLDVAIGPNGPVIVELNPSPDKEGAAFMGIGFPE